MLQDSLQRMIDPMNPTIPTLQANNAFFYYADLDRATRFYGEIMGFEQMIDYGFARTSSLRVLRF